MRLRYATGANQCKSSPICLSVMKKEIAFSTLARLNPCTSLRYLRMNSPLFGSGKWTSSSSHNFIAVKNIVSMRLSSFDSLAGTGGSTGAVPTVAGSAMGADCGALLATGSMGAFGATGLAAGGLPFDGGGFARPRTLPASSSASLCVNASPLSIRLLTPSAAAFSFFLSS